MVDNTSKHVTDCYNNLADEYDFFFLNWHNTMKRHAKIIDTVVKQKIKKDTDEIKLYDASCGIGTQAIGLSLMGYDVFATDLCENEIVRAKKEAEKLGANLTFGIADFRSIDTQVNGNFDVVISFDNSIPHLLEPSEMYKTLDNIYSKLNEDGMFLASLWDYDRLIVERPNIMPPYLYEEKRGRRISLHTWDWNEDNTYTLTIYNIWDKEGKCETHSYKTRFRAYTRQELSEMLEKIGYKNIEWIEPGKLGHGYQIVTAIKKTM